MLPPTPIANKQDLCSSCFSSRLSHHCNILGLSWFMLWFFVDFVPIASTIWVLDLNQKADVKILKIDVKSLNFGWNSSYWQSEHKKLNCNEIDTNCKDFDIWHSDILTKGGKLPNLDFPEREIGWIGTISETWLHFEKLTTFSQTWLHFWKVDYISVMDLTTFFWDWLDHFTTFNWDHKSKKSFQISNLTHLRNHQHLNSLPNSFLQTQCQIHCKSNFCDGMSWTFQFCTRLVRRTIESLMTDNSNIIGIIAIIIGIRVVIGHIDIIITINLHLHNLTAQMLYGSLISKVLWISMMMWNLTLNLSENDDKPRLRLEMKTNMYKSSSPNVMNKIKKRKFYLSITHSSNFFGERVYGFWDFGSWGYGLTLSSEIRKDLKSDAEEVKLR